MKPADEPHNVVAYTKRKTTRQTIVLYFVPSFAYNFIFETQYLIIREINIRSLIFTSLNRRIIASIDR